jgi:AI-2 transport system permease protein
MRIRYGWELALAALLVIEIVAFGAINPRMLDLNMLLFSTSDFICIGIVALPLTMVIVSGGIDISFGSTIGLCAIALGVLFQSGVPMPLAILLTLLLGALCGLINAGLIIYTKVNPLVITLGTLYLFAGSALLLSGMAGATGYEGIGGFPMAFTDFANLDVLGLPVPLIIFLICLLVFWLWLHKTHAGRNVFLIGQSPRVAVYSAIPVLRHRFCSGAWFYGTPLRLHLYKLRRYKSANSLPGPVRHRSANCLLPVPSPGGSGEKLR